MPFSIKMNMITVFLSDIVDPSSLWFDRNLPSNLDLLLYSFVMIPRKSSPGGHIGTIHPKPICYNIMKTLICFRVSSSPKHRKQQAVARRPNSCRCCFTISTTILKSFRFCFSIVFDLWFSGPSISTIPAGAPIRVWLWFGTCCKWVCCFITRNTRMTSINVCIPQINMSESTYFQMSARCIFFLHIRGYKLYGESNRLYVRRVSLKRIIWINNGVDNLCHLKRIIFFVDSRIK